MNVAENVRILHTNPPNKITSQRLPRIASILETCQVRRGGIPLVSEQIVGVLFFFHTDYGHV